jgi:hypothetical protein
MSGEKYASAAVLIHEENSNSIILIFYGEEQ